MDYCNIKICLYVMALITILVLTNLVGYWSGKQDSGDAYLRGVKDGRREAVEWILRRAAQLEAEKEATEGA